MASVNIAKTFTSASKKLSTTDRGRVLDFLTKFMADPASPGLNFETITHAGAGIKSARITQDLRTILHQSDGNHTLLYVGHHEDAYRWAERRRMEHHPVTGDLQIVETAETVEQIAPEVPSSAVRVFQDYDDDYLLSLGVPEDWLPTVRQISNEDQLLAVAQKLPEEVSVYLLTLSSGELITPPTPVDPALAVTANLQNQRRFWVVEDIAGLRQVLEKPLADWTRYLHPSQRKIVDTKFNGPVKVSGAAGTGKTVVGMHRARALAAQGKRVLMTSYVTTICNNIQQNIHVLCEQYEARSVPLPEKLITVGTVHKQALSIAKKTNSRIQPCDDDKISQLLSRHSGYADFAFDSGFLQSEWTGVIAPQGISCWDEYRDAVRTGRGKPLNVRQRKQCWKVFARVQEALAEAHTYPWSEICRIARQAVETGQVVSPFDAVIIDEVQDLQPQELKFLASLCDDNMGELMLLGDAGQRIYPGGYSLSKLGINIRGRSHILRINYRTTEQIRKFADSLLSDKSDDLDEGLEDRKSKSLLQGPTPEKRGFKTVPQQCDFIIETIRRLLNEGILANEIALFARTKSQFKEVEDALRDAGMPVSELSSDQDLTKVDGINVGTMHRAKGLEFKCVFAVNCADGIVPHRYTLSQLTEPDDYESGLARERQLLYVAVTRARDEAFITWVGKRTPFIQSD